MNAEASGLVAFVPNVAFRHPLVRSVVYYSAAASDRRRVHAALAEALDPDLDADRRAWHLGAAAAGPDERVASVLEASAERARQRGGASAAAFLLWRAAELTPDRERATARLLEAARGGAGGRARTALPGDPRARQGDRARRPASGRGGVDRGADPHRRRRRAAGRVSAARGASPDRGRSAGARCRRVVAAVAAGLSGGHLIQQPTRRRDRRGCAGRRRTLRSPGAHRLDGGRSCCLVGRRARAPRTRHSGRP